MGRANTVTGATIVGYGQCGVPAFFTFLIQNRIACKPAELTRAIVAGYVDWIKVQPQWGFTSQKTVYTSAKSVLVALQRRSIVPCEKGMFPANPFPGTREQRDAKHTLLVSEREKNRRLREDLSKLLVELQDLASINEGLRQELTVAQAIADGKIARFPQGGKEGYKPLM
jgi:hypothetical protein